MSFSCSSLQPISNRQLIQWQWTLAIEWSLKWPLKGIAEMWFGRRTEQNSQAIRLHLLRVPRPMSSIQPHHRMQGSIMPISHGTPTLEDSQGSSWEVKNNTVFKSKLRGGGGVVKARIGPIGSLKGQWGAMELINHLLSFSYGYDVPRTCFQRFRYALSDSVYFKNDDLRPHLLKSQKKLWVSSNVSFALYQFHDIHLDDKLIHGMLLQG